MMSKLYVQYGCGFIAPKEWVNFDASPTLRIQRLPVIGQLLGARIGVVFPKNVRYGDIVKGLPIEDGTCDGVYCSNILEHLSLQDCRTALKNTYRILKNGGVFRCVVPDLEREARNYISSLDKGDDSASIAFVGANTYLGVEERPRTVRQYVQFLFGNSHHLWMWDTRSLTCELLKVGFARVRPYTFADDCDSMFKLVQERSIDGAVALECWKK